MIRVIIETTVKAPIAIIYDVYGDPLAAEKIFPGLIKILDKRNREDYKVGDVIKHARIIWKMETPFFVTVGDSVPLVSISTQVANRYAVTEVICAFEDLGSETKVKVTYISNAKPLFKIFEPGMARTLAKEALKTISKINSYIAPNEASQVKVISKRVWGTSVFIAEVISFFISFFVTFFVSYFIRHR